MDFEQLHHAVRDRVVRLTGLTTPAGHSIHASIVGGRLRLTVKPRKPEDPPLVQTGQMHAHFRDRPDTVIIDTAPPPEPEL